MGCSLSGSLPLAYGEDALPFILTFNILQHSETGHRHSRILWTVLFDYQPTNAHLERPSEVRRRKSKPCKSTFYSNSHHEPLRLGAKTIEGASKGNEAALAIGSIHVPFLLNGT